MKTPMQFLKKEIENKRFPPEYNEGNLTDYQYGHNVAYGVVLNIIEYAIELEKEHIIKAVNITEQEAVDFCNEQVKHYYDHEGMFGAVPEAGINYYNETYNDNE